MKKKFYISLVVAILAITGFVSSLYINKADTTSYFSLSNIDAIARNESGSEETGDSGCSHCVMANGSSGIRTFCMLGTGVCSYSKCVSGTCLQY